MNDKVSVRHSDNETLSTKIASGDLSGVSMTGHCIDKIYKNGVLVEEIEGHNLVVGSFVNLVMALIKRTPGYSGAQYWAVGSGSATWDEYMPEPSLEDLTLLNEIGRVEISPNEIEFLTPDYGTSDSPTNIIQITHTFGEGDCNGVWREFAIFGGNAIENRNSGIMINKRHHSVLTKTEEMTVERTMRFTLNLV